MFVSYTVAQSGGEKMSGSSNGAGGGGSSVSASTGSPLVTGRYQIEGKVVMPKEGSGFKLPKNWQSYTRILVNYGEYVGFVK